MIIEDEELLRQGFSQVKKCCDRIVLAPSLDQNWSDLELCLDKIGNFGQQLFDYVIIPIYVHLYDRSDIRESTVCTVLKCLKVILTKLKVDHSSHFWKIHSALFLQLNDEHHPGQLVNTSDELKMLVLSNAVLLFRNSSDSVIKSLYESQFSGKLSVGVYTCTKLSTEDYNVDIRVRAFQYLQRVFHVHARESVEFRQKLRAIVSLMFPGVVSCCWNVFKNQLTNHAVLIEAVKLYGGAVSLVLENEDNLNITTVFKNETANERSWTNPIDSVPVQSKEWRETTDLKIYRITLDMLKLQKHPHPRVRLQVAREVDRMLRFTYTNVKSSLTPLLEAIMVLSYDEDEKVFKRAREAIESFRLVCETITGTKFLELVEETLYSVVTRTPRILHGVDLTEIEKHLAIISGCVDVLGQSNLHTALNSVQLLNRLKKCLYAAATIDCSSVVLLEEVAIRDLDGGALSHSKPWKSLKFILTKNSLYFFEQVCAKLVEYSRPQFSIIYELLEDFDAAERYRKEILLLLCQLMSFHDLEYPEQVLELVFGAVVEMQIWNLPMSVSGDLKKPDVQSNVVQVCLAADLCASIAENFNPSAFSPSLLKCFYPLLECAGSPLSVISQAGQEAVSRLAALYKGEIGDLVSQNVDYLSHHVTYNLRLTPTNTKVLSVITAILRHSTYAVFPSIHEIINDVLVQSCDTFQEVNATSFLHVFLAFVTQLHEWTKREPVINCKPKRTIFEQIMEYHKAYVQAHNFNDDEADDVVNETAPTEELQETEEKKTQSDHIKLTVDVLNRSIHFLPSKDISRQILVLQILDKGVLILSQSQDDLLPIVHKIWSPLVPRFTASNNFLVVQRAFSLLLTLARHSQNFIRARTLKEVLPSLRQFLAQKCALSRKEKRSQAYLLTQQYKLQLCLLSGLGELAIHLDLNGKEVYSIVETVSEYLSSVQPQTLQRAAMDSLRCISKKDPDTVWAHLMYMCPIPTQLMCGSDPFVQHSPNEFNKNVHELLEELK